MEKDLLSKVACMGECCRRQQLWMNQNEVFNQETEELGWRFRSDPHGFRSETSDEYVFLYTDNSRGGDQFTPEKHNPDAEQLPI